MNWSVFCSLAFCAFQTVFAEDANNFGSGETTTKEETQKKLTETENKFKKPFQDAVDALKLKGKGADEIKLSMNNCLEKFTLSEKSYKILITATDKCNQCYDQSGKTKDAKLANKCCDEAMDPYLKSGKENIRMAVKCVGKCDKLGNDDCLKMLRDIQTEL